MSNQIKAGALLSYVSIFLSIIAGIIYTPWMVKQIGLSDYGLYVLVSSFLTYFIMDFGLGEAIARFVSKYKKGNQIDDINNLLGLVFKIYLAIDFVICVGLIIVYFSIPFFFKELNEIELQKFKTIFLIAGSFSIISFPFSTLNSVFIAYERYVFIKFCDIISKVGTILLMAFALFCGYKLYSLVLINAVVGIFLILLKLNYLNKLSEIKINFKFKDKKLLKQIFSFSVWVTVIGIAQRLLFNIAPTLLASLSGTAAIAIFSIGNVIEGYVFTFASALNGLFLPKVTELSANASSRSAITDLMIKVGRIQLFVIGILFIGIITLGEEFIVIWMGEKFKSSYNVVVLLILPGFITLTQSIASTLIYVENKVRFTALMQISCSLTSVLISYLFIPKMGAMGAAIGIFTGLVIFQVIGMNIIYQKVLKINILRFFKDSFLKMVPALLCSLLIGFLINFFIKTNNFFVFGLKVLVLSVIYLVIMWFLALNKYEKDLLSSLMKKILLYKIK